MNQKRLAALGVVAGLLGGGAAGAALGIPGLAGAQSDETTTTTDSVVPDLGVETPLDSSTTTAPAESTPETTAPAAEAPATADPQRDANKANKGDWARDALAALVANGTITQAQAGSVIAALEAARPAKGPHHGGPGMRGGHAKLDAAATVLGVTVEELRNLLAGGKSLAELAKDKGVDVQKVIDALVADLRTHLAEHVAQGKNTQAEVDQMLADATARITAFVNGEAPAPGGFGGRGRGKGPRPAPSSNSSTQPSSATVPA